MKRWGEIKNVGYGYGSLYKEKFYAVLFGCLCKILPGYVHPNRQSSILLSGRAKYLKKEGDNLISMTMEVGKQVDVDAGVPHILLAEEDTLRIKWWDGEFKAEPYKIMDVEERKPQS